MENKRFLKRKILKLILLLFVISLTPVFADGQKVMPPPAWKISTDVEAVSPEEADAILKQKSKEKALRLKQRKLKQQKKSLDQKSTHSSLIDSVFEFVFPSAYAVETLLAGSTAPDEAEITELARALKNDPGLIYEYVYGNIAYEPTFGDKKGAVGTLLDKSGNSFDQATLMVALLRKSGYDARYIYGKIRVSPEQYNAWLGTVSYIQAANILSNGGIPFTPSPYT